MKNKFAFAASILIGLWILSSIFGFFFSLQSNTGSGNVAVVPVTGPITVQKEEGFLSGQSTSSDELIKTIDKINLDHEIKAVIFEINSPGGSPVATDEIVQKIKSLNKTKIAVIREVGASGAYWIASASDYIFANRMSITGSVGVYGAYLEYSGLLNKFNITYERMVAGEYKDMGSPFRNMTTEERLILQDILDKMQEFFIEDVRANRHLTANQIEEISTGRIYLGADALEINLVDELGTMEDAKKYLESELNMTVTTITYEERKSLVDILQGISVQRIAKFINSYSQGLSITT